jgi:autotransporter-associated beta strand protein
MLTEPVVVTTVFAADVTAPGLADITGTLEVVEVCYTDHAEQILSVADEKTGIKRQLDFAVPPEGHMTGERVRVRGRFQGEEIEVSEGANAGLEVLAAAKTSTNGTAGSASPKVLYGGGTTTSTVVHKTRVHLLIYPNYATNAFAAADITNFSNLFFATNGNSINTAYLEDTYGAVGFAGDVVVCPIAAPSGICDTGTWQSEANASAVAQGYTNAYDNYVYICSGACGWAGVAVVGGNWSFDFYTDGGTICHELGHNLGFAHASTELNNTTAWDEYGDSSDFMGGSYDWRHNNRPHKVQLGWVTAQPVPHAGTYQISRLEDVPGTVLFPQVLTVPSSSAYGGQADRWPYYFSYKQNIGFDVNSPWTYGLTIDRLGGGGSHTAAIAILSDGQSFTDSQIGLTVKQIRHDTNSVMVVITTCVGAAQPYTIAMTSAQIAARTTMLADEAVSTCDLMTITNFDSMSAKGGAITITNNQLFYTPPGIFSGNDTFNYTLVNSSGQSTSATVTIYNLSQPSYILDANGAVAGMGGTGIWDTVSTNWDNGTDLWPAGGSSNWALFGGPAGTVSLVTGSVAANGLDFKTDGFVITNNTLTLDGASPTMLVEPNVNAGINSIVAGSTGLTKLGQDTLTFSGANTYTGGTIISQGTLIANNTSALGAATGALTLGGINSAMSSVRFKVDTGVASAVVMASLNTSSFGTNQTITLNAGSALAANASELTVTALNLAGSSPLAIRASNTGGHSAAQDIIYRIIGPGISAGNTALTLDGTAASLRTSFPNGSAPNNFTGDVVIKGNVSTQNLGYNGNIIANQNLGFLNNNVTVSSNSTWTLVWGGETTGALNGSGNISLNNQSALNSIGLTVGNTGASGVYSGVISGGFGLSKTGTGTQTFTGANTYSGSTSVKAGKLWVSSAQTGTGAITISDGASLGVTVSGTSQLSPVILAEGSSAGPTTNEFSGVASTTVAPINAGTLTLKGTTMINISSGSFIAGQTYPLISYTNISGTGGFKLGTLTYGVTASLITNGNSIVLNVTALAPIVWNGSFNGIWDIATTANWKTNAAAATYNDGNAVQFDDTASGTTTVSNLVTVSPSGIIVSNITKDYIIGGSPIAGGGNLTKAGGGTLTLSGANTFTGGLTLTNGGTINPNNGAVFGSGGTLTLSGGTIYPTSGVQTYSNPIFVTAGTTNNLFGYSGGGQYPKFTGAVTGSGTIQNMPLLGGLGNAFINGDISGFTGAFDVESGPASGENFQFAGGTAASYDGSQAHFVVNGTGSGALYVAETANATFRMGDLAGAGGRISTINNVNLEIGALNTSTTFAGVIAQDTGSLNLIKVGTGTLTLIGANNYSGTTTVSNGALVVSSAQSTAGAFTVNDGAALGVMVSGTNQLKPGTLLEGNTSGAVNYFSGISSTMVAPISAGTLAFSGTTTISVLSGILSVGYSYPLIAYTNSTGAGNFVVGMLPYGMTGIVTNTGSNIALNVVSIASLPPLVWNGNVNGIWDIVGTANWTSNGLARPYLDGASVRFDDTASGTTMVSNTVTISPASIIVNNMNKGYAIGGGTINCAGALTKSGTNTLTLTGPVTIGGAVTISAGTIAIGGAGQLNSGSFAPNITNNGVLNYISSVAQTLSGVISGTGILIQNGGGLLTLSGVNSYTGVTLINGGTLNIGASMNLPNTSALTLAGGGTLGFSAGLTLANNVTIAGGQTGTLKPGGAYNVTLSGNYSGVFGTLTLDLSNASGYSGFVVGSSTGPVGTVNVLALAGANSQIGLNNVSYQGFLGNAKVVFPASGYCYVAGGNGSATSLSFGALDGGNANTLVGFDNRTGNVTINGTTNGNFAGIIFNGYGSSGPLTFNKTGPGTQTLAGANTYTGPTTVSNGTLLVNGSLAAGSAVTVASAGTLGGSGTVNGTVAVNGAIAPGTRVGTLNTGTETWNGVGSYDCEINAINVTGCDLLNITGALNVQSTSGSRFTIKLVSLTSSNAPGPLAGFNKFTNNTWTIATASGGVSNFATNKFVLDTSAFSNDCSGGAFALAVAGNNLC